MGFFKQAFTVIKIGLYTIPQRLSSAGVAIIGIAGVVVVLVGVLSIAEGFEKAMIGAGRPDRAVDRGLARVWFLLFQRAGGPSCDSSPCL